MSFSHVDLQGLVFFFFYLVSSIPPDSYTQLHLLPDSPSFEEEDLMEKSYLALTIPRSLILYVIFGCGSLHLFLPIVEEQFSDDG